MEDVKRRMSVLLGPVFSLMAHPSYQFRRLVPDVGAAKGVKGS